MLTTREIAEDNQGSVVESTSLVASYSLTNNSFESHTKRELEEINIHQFNENSHDRNSRRSTLTDSLLHTLIKGGKANCLLTCLIGTALVTSVLNTLLLSFVVKSIQLNDKGFINGKVTWDEQIDSTVFKLLTKGESISLKSIESFDDKPLRLKIWSKGNDNLGHQQNNNLKETSVFLSTGQVITSSNYSFKSNYMAVNVNNYNGHPNTRALEIGTKSLMLNLINERETNHTNNWLFDFNQRVNGRKKMASIETRRLLEFNGKQQSITLPLENQLNLKSLASGSVVVNEELRSSDITGSLEENLDIQTRDGNMACRSEETLRLMSKSAGAKITTFEEMALSAPSLILSSKQLYIPNGIQYFDSDENFNAENIILTQSDIKSVPQFDQLRAYNLVTFNGLLMAN